MFLHIFKNRLKIILRDSMMLFWGICFPVILATLFHFALSGFGKSLSFKPVNIAVVENENFQKLTGLKEMIGDLSKEGTDQLFVSKYVSRESASEMLEKNTVKAYILVDDLGELNVVVKNNGFEQTIVKSVIDSYYQTSSVIVNMLEWDYKLVENSDIVGTLNSQKDFFRDTTSSNLNIVVIFFYSLIGMVCIQAGYFGMDAINDNEANMSKKGARSAISPVNKFTSILASLLAGFVAQIFILSIMLTYIITILHVDFGDDILRVILISLCGSLAGICLGMFVAASNRRDNNGKTAIFLVVTLTCSFLSGMMGVDIKYLVSEHIPILAKINPVSLITDALYSLYYFDGNLSRYNASIISLLIFSVITVLFTYIFIRKRKYDSI